MAALAQQEPQLDAAGAEEVIDAIAAATGRSFLLLACLALSPALPAQTPQDAPNPQALLAQLRAADLTLAAATTASEPLRIQSTSIRLQASDLLRAAFLARLDKHTKAVDKLAKDVERASATVLKRVDQQAEARVEELRVLQRTVTRRQDLSKEMIVRELDPGVDELRAILLPTPEQVLAADSQIAGARTERQQERRELAAWFALYVAMLDGFDINPDAQKHLEKTPPPDAPLPPQRLDAEFEEWLLLGLPLSARDRRTVQENALLRGKIDREEYAGTRALNVLRYLLGLPMVRIDLKLGDAARDHSRDMVKLGFFDHTSPVPGKGTFGERAGRFGTSASSENIAAGQETGPGAITAWWHSPGHHRNMLGNHGRTGLGRDAATWTQLFGG